jgi:hypothetical protein
LELPEEVKSVLKTVVWVNTRTAVAILYIRERVKQFATNMPSVTENAQVSD